MTRKQILLILALAIVLLLGGIAFLVWKRASVQTGSPENLALTARREACDAQADPVACRGRVEEDRAVFEESTTPCKSLEEEQRGACVRAVARLTGDATDCRAAEGDQRAICQDEVAAAKARAKGLFVLCAEVKDAERRGRCEEALITKAVATGACDEAGVEPKLCDAARVYMQAVASLDPSACQDVGDADGQDACRQEILERTTELADADEDQDGLTTTEEKKWGTDPAQRDTDGDGYPDGEEVKGGYNPLGAGSLPS